MGIDGVGKRTSATPPAPAGADGPPAASRPAEAARAFELDSPRIPSPPAASVDLVSGPSPTAPSSLDLLRAGQIDVGRYLDLKVDEATAHLSALPRAELEAIRGALRDRLAVDPTLVELVRAAAAADTGKPAP